MSIDVGNNQENNNKKENISLTQEKYFQFEQSQARVCEIKQEGDKESIFSQIESYNIIQELTTGKAEYCTQEGIEYIVRSGDTLTKICLEYYGSIQFAYELMEMYGVFENIGIGQVLLLPERIGENQLKEKHRRIILESELTQLTEENKRIKKILNQYDYYLEITHKLDYHITSFNPSSSNIGDTRYQLYKDVLNDENLEIKEKNPNLYRNLNDYLTGEDVFLDWDEELKVFLLEEKAFLLENLPGIEEKLEGESSYRNLQAAKHYFQNRMRIESTDALSFLDVPLYNYMEAFEQDYLKSVYLNQEFDMGKVNGILKVYEFVRGDFEYTDIKEYIELIGGTFNGARGLSWRTLKLGTDLVKSINSEIIYDIGIGEDALVEGSMRLVFEWEKYIDNASLSQFIKGTEGTVLMAPALASGIIDGYMDAVATIGMFIVEPEQLIRDMKKIPELLKHIDMKELYKLYAETFDGKPEELYPAIMYTLAYIYVLMIAMPLAATNLVSKVGELGGKIIGKGKFRKELRELEVEKIKFRELNRNFREMNDYNKGTIDLLNKIQKNEHQKISILKKEIQDIIDKGEIIKISDDIGEGMTALIRLYPDMQVPKMQEMGKEILKTLGEVKGTEAKYVKNLDYNRGISKLENEYSIFYNEVNNRFTYYEKYFSQLEYNIHKEALSSIQKENFGLLKREREELVKLNYALNKRFKEWYKNKETIFEERRTIFLEKKDLKNEKAILDRDAINIKKNIDKIQDAREEKLNKIFRDIERSNDKDFDKLEEFYVAQSDMFDSKLKKVLNGGSNLEIRLKNYEKKLEINKRSQSNNNIQLEKLEINANDIFVQHKEIFENISVKINRLYKELSSHKESYMLDRENKLNLQINELNDNIGIYINAVGKGIENSASRINDSSRIIGKQTNTD